MKHLLLRRDERCNIPLMGCYKRLQSLSLYIIIALLLQQWTTATATLLWWISVEWSNKITNRVRFTAGVVSRIKNFILTPPPPPPPVHSCKSSRLGWGEARRGEASPPPSSLLFLLQSVNGRLSSPYTCLTNRCYCTQEQHPQYCTTCCCRLTREIVAHMTF